MQMGLDRHRYMEAAVVHWKKGRRFCEKIENEKILWQSSGADFTNSMNLGKPLDPEP